MTSLESLEKPFLDHLERLYAQNAQSQAHTLAWERFCALGLSSYKYVKLRHLYEKRFVRASLQEPQKKFEPATLVFVNGHYCESLSNREGLQSEIVILPLSSAQRSYGAFLQGHMKSQLKNERDPFGALNSAMATDGLFIYVPPKCQSRAPLYIHHVVDVENALLLPRVQLYVGKEACLEIFVRDVNRAENFKNSAIDALIDERGSLKLTTLLEQGENSFVMESVRTTLKKGSLFNALSVTNGAKSLRQNFQIELIGTDAEARVQGACLLNCHREAHVNVHMAHRAPHTRSLQKFKAVLADSSRSSFEGKIVVAREAQKTEAYQVNHNLVLDRESTAYSEPNLEIFADDVKASHGATFGQIDKEQLFYLMSRGMPHVLAKKLLIYGFSREILDQITSSALHKEALLLAHEAFLP